MRTITSGCIILPVAATDPGLLGCGCDTSVPLGRSFFSLDASTPAVQFLIPTRNWESGC